MINTPSALRLRHPLRGSIAVIVSAATRRPTPQMPVLVESVGTQILEPVEWDQGTITHEPQVLGPSRTCGAARRSRRPTSTSALLYDGFSFNCLSGSRASGSAGSAKA